MNEEKTINKRVIKKDEEFRGSIEGQVKGKKWEKKFSYWESNPGDP